MKILFLHLPFFKFDHHLILVKLFLETISIKTKDFHFMASWLTKTSFLEVVCSSWLGQNRWDGAAKVFRNNVES